MDLIDKAQIIIEFTEQEFYNPEFDEFFDCNDLGIPVSVSLVNKLVTLTAAGEKIFNETWAELCALFGADPEADYKVIDDLIT